MNVNWDICVRYTLSTIFAIHLSSSGLHQALDFNKEEDLKIRLYRTQRAHADISFIWRVENVGSA